MRKPAFVQATYVCMLFLAVCNTLLVSVYVPMMHIKLERKQFEENKKIETQNKMMQQEREESELNKGSESIEKALASVEQALNNVREALGGGAENEQQHDLTTGVVCVEESTLNVTLRTPNGSRRGSEQMDGVIFTINPLSVSTRTRLHMDPVITNPDKPNSRL